MSLSLYNKLDMYNKHWLIDQYNLPPPPDTLYNYRPKVIKKQVKKEEVKKEEVKKEKVKKTPEQLAEEEKQKSQLKVNIENNKKTIELLNKRARTIKYDKMITLPTKKKYLSELKIIVSDTILKSRMLKDRYNKLNN